MSEPERYTFLSSEVVEAILEEGMPDCEKLELQIEGNQLVVLIHGAKRGGKKPAQERRSPPEKKKEDRPKGGEFSIEAGRLCANPGFQKFLEVADAEKAKQSIYQICGVTSRALIDHDENASKEWVALVAEFEFWQRGF